MTLIRQKPLIVVLLALATVIFAAIIAEPIMAQNGTTLMMPFNP
jgi:hypothetical protein